MQADSPFDVPSDLLRGCHLAQVTSVRDPDGLGRVKVRLLMLDGDGAAEIWARVAAPFAGSRCGAFLLPDVGDEVLVQFLSADPRFPIVIGGLWNGSARPPETLPADRVDRWSITGKAGTRIAIVEQQSGAATISFTTPGGLSGVLEDSGGGKVEFRDSAGNSIKLDSQGVTLSAASAVTVTASQVKVSAGTVNVDAAMSKFSGVVKCDVLMASTVVATTYTPGAGNVW
jgi:uncharacterized protein involved in type VI secretion and phage assembly